MRRGPEGIEVVLENAEEGQKGEGEEVNTMMVEASEMGGSVA